MDYRLPPDVRIQESLVPLSESTSWADELLDIEGAWKQAQGKGVIVCVLDTGLSNHEDMEGAIIATKDFTGSRHGSADVHGHGSHVSSLIAARSGNDVGIRGIAPLCKIVHAKVLGDSGGGGEPGIVAGMQWGYAQGAHVFSLSLGGGGRMVQLDGLLAELRQDAKRRNRPFVALAAAGNDGAVLNNPAAQQGFMAVGAYGQDGRITRFTSRSAKLKVLGPGVEMLGCLPGNRYGLMSGTSQATPVVAGVVTLAISKEMEAGSESALLTSEDAEEHILRNAVDAVNGSPFRLVNARKALESIGVKPIPAPPVDPNRLCGTRVFGPFQGYAVIKVT